MKKERPNSGFTLLELVLSIALASGLMAGVVGMNIPLLVTYQDSFNSQRVLAAVNTVMDVMSRDVYQSKTVYVDSGQCYFVCMVDSTGENRTYYYFLNGALYRKTESAKNPINCAQGKTISTDLTPGQSTAVQQGALANVTLTSTIGGNTFVSNGAFLAGYGERVTPFYDGFEGNSLSSHGWVVAGSGVGWAIEQNSSADGGYWLKQSLTGDQGAPVTATATFPVNLSRVTSAYLFFQYQNTGVMSVGELLKVEYFDGTTWQEIFRDDTGRGVPALQTAVVDLSPFTLSQSASLRFTGYLQSGAHNWYLDDIQINTK